MYYEHAIICYNRKNRYTFVLGNIERLSASVESRAKYVYVCIGQRGRVTQTIEMNICGINSKSK